MIVNMSYSPAEKHDVLAALLSILAPHPEATFLMKWHRPDGTWAVMIVDRSLDPDEGGLMLLADRQGWHLARKGDGSTPQNFWGVVTWFIDRP